MRLPQRSTALVTALIATLLASCTSTPTSADQQACLDVMEDFFEVIETCDAELGSRIALPEATFVNVSFIDGERSLRTFTCAQWLAAISRREEHFFEEFLDEPTVLLDEDIAVVWGEYYFLIDGELSHTGVDAFHLVKTETGWKIAGGAYTVIR